jgi:hypothetical protein
MAYLDNTDIIVDAILTKKGRSKLASGQQLAITKFALADDEIDYTLYEPAHPKGTPGYDSAIRAIPVTEATPDETQVMRYKLVTLSKNTVKIPVVSLAYTAIIANTGAGATTITPSTTPVANTTAGYTAILSDSRAGTLIGQGTVTGTTPVFLGDIGSVATVVSGTSFSFTPSSTLKFSLTTTLTVYGNETGGSTSIPVQITYKAS